MTAYELASRITMDELDEWARLSQTKDEERKQDERIARVRNNAQANRRNA